MIIEGAAFWRRLWAWILWGNVIGSVTGKTETGGGVKSTLSVSAIFNVSTPVEKWLLTEYILKVTSNCAIL